GIRKNSQNYVCTPSAMIPFAGTVGDSTDGSPGGIDRIDYSLTIVKLESPGVQAVQTGWVAGTVGNFAPQALPFPATAQFAETARQLAASAAEPTPRTFPMDSFQQLIRERATRDVTRDELLRRLAQDPGQSPLIVQYEVKPQYEGLDLRERLPDLKVRDD